MNLRPHQIAARDAILARLAEGVDTQLCALPTGTGKTALAVALSREFGRTLFVVHRQELARQTAETVSRFCPDVPVGFVMPGKHDLSAPFVVAMIGTLHRRRDRIPADAFDLVIIDEAHHAQARTWRECAEHFTPRLRLGLSATPERMDGSDLSNLFAEISYEMTAAAAIDQGYLVPPVARQCLTSCDVSNVKTLAGDFNEKELAGVVDCPDRNGFVVQKYREHAPGRRAIAFAVNIAHAKNLAAAFSDAGIAADWLSGDSPDRAEKLAAFRSGDIRVLASCMVLTEGFDDPAVDCVLLARPTKSRPLFAQMVGRGLRLYEGKEDCVVLDFVDLAGKHQLASAWKFFGHQQEATEEPADYDRDAQQGPRETRVIAADIDRAVSLLKPPPDVPMTFQYGRHAWHFEPATDRQLAVLSSLGYDETADYSRGQASAIIGQQPPSVAQLRLLASLGYDTNRDWTRAQVNAALEESKATHAALLKKIRSAGFRVEADGWKLIVEPKPTPVQAAWMHEHKSGLLLALRG